jgi:hypothetical protein
MAGKLEVIKELFDLRLLGGEVPAETFMKFNRLRFDIIEKHPEYEKYLKSKSSTIRMFVNVFLKFPNELLSLALRNERGDKDGKPDAE